MPAHRPAHGGSVHDGRLWHADRGCPAFRPGPEGSAPSAWCPCAAIGDPADLADMAAETSLTGQVDMALTSPDSFYDLVRLLDATATTFPTDGPRTAEARRHGHARIREHLTAHADATVGDLRRFTAAWVLEQYRNTTRPVTDPFADLLAVFSQQLEVLAQPGVVFPRVFELEAQATRLIQSVPQATEPQLLTAANATTHVGSNLPPDPVTDAQRAALLQTAKLITTTVDAICAVGDHHERVLRADVRYSNAKVNSSQFATAVARWNRWGHPVPERASGPGAFVLQVPADVAACFAGELHAWDLGPADGLSAAQIDTALELWSSSGMTLENALETARHLTGQR